VAVFAEGGINLGLQHLQQCLLDQPIQHRGDAQLALAAYFGECDRSFRRIVTGGLRGDFSAVSVT
jgi:hypothetical protein